MTGKIYYFLSRYWMSLNVLGIDDMYVFNFRIQYIFGVKVLCSLSSNYRTVGQEEK